MCDTYNCDYLKHSTFRFSLIDFQLNTDFPFPILRSFFTVKQGFQLLGIAWREKHQVRRARTYEWGPGPHIGPLMGPGGKPLTGVQSSAPLCRTICLWLGRMHIFRPLSSLDLYV